MTTSEKTRAMVEGALMAVISAILGISGLYFPFLALITTFLVPVPIIILIRKYSLRNGIMALLVTAFLIFLLSGDPLSSLFLTIQFGGLAIVYGLAFKNSFSPGKTILAGGLTFLLSSVLSLLISFLLTGINPLDVTNAAKDSIEQTISIMRNSGQLDELAQRGITEGELRDQIKQMISLLKTLLPTMALLSSLLLGYINYIISRKILLRLGFKVPEMLAFRELRLPWYAIWIVILGMGLTLLGDQINIGLVKSVGSNLTFAGMLVFFAVGLAFIIFFYKNSAMSKFLKVFLIVFMILNLPAGFWMLTLIGLGDTIFNLRRFITGEKTIK